MSDASGSGSSSKEHPRRHDVYTQSTHIMAIFLILILSFLGTLIPILTKHVSWMNVHPFVITVGKCIATGVVLAVALVHMLQPAEESLSDDNLPFHDAYEPMSYALCMGAALLMHLIDVTAEIVFKLVMTGDVEIVDAEDVTVVGTGSSDMDKEKEHLTNHHHGEQQQQQQGNGGASNALSQNLVEVKEAHEGYGVFEDPHSGHSHGAGGHSHLGGAAKVTPSQRIIAAMLMEFGVTLHSVFIGLTVGLSRDATLETLLVAISFHQFFEGMALGSRLADTSFHLSLETIFALIFSFSAPIGTAIGVVYMAKSNESIYTNAYITTQGILDALCAGILLYLGFGLLLNDFVADMRKFCATVGPNRNTRGRALLNLALMFIGLWTGAGVMAYIGKYL